MAERFRRAVLNFVKLRPVTAVMSVIMAPLDRLLHRISGGRLSSLAQWVLPTMVLYSYGAKSGQRREHTLVYVRDDTDAILLVGTNFGGDNHPAWTYNLLANPRAEVDVDGEVTTVVAEPVAPADQGRYWPRFDAVYSGYASYRQRIGDSREIRMFRLVPAA